jgi:hypothetical protein
MLGIASAPGNRHDSHLLAATLTAASRQVDGLAALEGLAFELAGRSHATSLTPA